MSAGGARTWGSTRASEAWSERYGPWAIVTGASDGIGQETARQLSAAGIDLVLVARRRQRLEALGEELPGRVRIVPADLGEREGISAVLAAIESLDVGLVVASAGFGTSGSFLDLDAEVESNMIDVNCRSVVELLHAMAPRLVARGAGGIILMSSLVAFQGVPRATTYAASKAFIQSLAEGLRLELGPRGVDVLASAPGPVASGFGARADMTMSSAMSPATVAKQTLLALGRRTTVRPGFMSKLLERSLSLLPRWARARIVGLVMRGMTRHQDVPRQVAPGARRA